MTVNYRGDIVRANTTLGLGGVDIIKWPLLDEDVQAIRANIMFSMFYTMSLVAQGQLAVDDGIVDAYQDESGIDTGSSVNALYDGSGKYYTNFIPVSVANEDNAVINTNSQTYNFNSVSFGAASSDRIIAVFISSGLSAGPFLINSLTIGGVSAGNGVAVANSKSRCEIWYAQVPSGTTGNIVINYAGVMPSCAISLFRLINASLIIKDTLADAADPLTNQIDVGAGGAVIAGAHNFDASATISWSGLTEDIEQVEDSGHSSAAHDQFSFDDPTHTITTNIAGTTSDPAMVAMSWQPAVNGLTLQSQAFTADSVPTEAHLLVFVNDFTSPAYNTDFKGYVSRDGGTTWTQVTLTAEVAGFSGQKFVQGSVDISGQPSGTSMLYKITTHNGHLFLINGASLFWK